MSIEQELAEMGLRLAADWELGWYTKLEDGRAFWVTDDCKVNVLGTYWQICGASGDGLLQPQLGRRHGR